jgi:hypothetical protein
LIFQVLKFRIFGSFKIFTYLTFLPHYYYYYYHHHHLATTTTVTTTNNNMIMKCIFMPVAIVAIGIATELLKKSENHTRKTFNRFTAKRSYT